MKYNLLGNTGLFVSQFCLGGMTFGGNENAGMWKNIGQLQQAEVDGLIKEAHDSGVNFIDTADIYSFGESERLIGQSIRNLGIRRKDIVIATKTGGPMSQRQNDRGASRAHILASIEQSLKRLQTDYIDLYQIHINDSNTPLEETIDTLDSLVQRGLIRYFGLSNWRAGRIAKANGISMARGKSRFDSLQAHYSIASRDIEREIIPLVREEKMGLLIWSPLAGGLLSGKFGPGTKDEKNSRRSHFDFPPVNKDRAWACIEEMRKVASVHRTSVAQIALAWILSETAVSSIIVGAKKVEQLKDNLKAGEIELSPAEHERLNAVSELPIEYPEWMIQMQEQEKANS